MLYVAAVIIAFLAIGACECRTPVCRFFVAAVLLILTVVVTAVSK